MSGRTHKVGLGRLLQGKDGHALEAVLVVGDGLGYLADEALEGQPAGAKWARERSATDDNWTEGQRRQTQRGSALADEELSALLVSADLTEGRRARAVAVGLPDSAHLGSGLDTCRK